MATAEAVRPILFSGEMVRAILDGRKTVTRRLCKLRDPSETYSTRDDGGWPVSADEYGDWHRDPCPYGQPGDLLWVRETWASPSPQIVAYRADAECGAWMGDGAGGRLWIRHGLIHESPAYRTGRFPATTYSLAKYGGKWRPSIHMPRWASRITLRITSVRVERLHAITHEDALAEGCAGFNWVASSPCIVGPHTDDGELPVEEFAGRWDEINGKGAWDKNPWVWVVSFEREPTP